MNRIFSYRGIRLYQSSYDEDMQGAILTVNRDVWGIPVTYTGYFLLFISMLWVLFSPNGSMRRLLKNPLLRKNVFMFVFLLLPLVSLQANRETNRVLPRNDAAKFGEVQVLYNGRITLLQTLAYDFSKKVTGSVSHRGYTPEQFLSGWIFYPGLWKYEPCIHVKSAAVRKMFNLNEYAALTDFFDQTSTYIFESYWSELHQGKLSSLQKAISEVDEKVQLILMLSKGELLKVFPVAENGQIVWCNSTAQLPDNTDVGQRLFVKKMFALLNEQVIKKNSEEFHLYVEKLLNYQLKSGGESVLSSSKVKAELTYNRLPYVPLLFRMNLTLGLLMLMLLVTELVRQKAFAGSRLLFGGGVVCLFLSFAFLTFCIGLRTYISGRWPMGNGFETMVFMAWCVMLIALCFYKRFRLVVPFGFLLSGFFLLVASFSMMNPQITPLMPVLSSPLLSLHVSTIMMSYALLAFTFLGGVVSLFLYAVKRTPETKKQIETLQLISRLFLIPGLFFLAAGIFIGAIWANISWGRYWAWDPKEVWALITLLVYSMAVHTQSLKIFRKPVFFHIYMCLSFLTVLMTYFGVNYVLGGLHSYA
ncbi:cytochrome C biogenesis protein [Bacteroides sp. 224]|nr:cytochrome C biogenesis protein [Bacteroides sp. 224]